MSQSPTADATSDEIRAYDVGWAATNKLIRAGRSFSGRERHCVFLNTGGGNRFADISALSGLDFPDDGRGLALTDWDHDGRVDLWFMNRNGPRVRFLRNELPTANQFVALKLQGTSANRDAIGARVEILCDPPAVAGRLVKSVYAGSGYLSQSSKWLHFGLGGSGADITEVRVRWPGGGEEVFSGVAPGGHFVLREGDGEAVRWQAPPVREDLFAGAGAAAVDQSPPEGGARVVLLEPAPFPAHLVWTNASGVEERIAGRFGGRPLIVNLWASWCPNCRREMTAWAAAEEALEAAGVEILSLCVDEPSGDPAADLAKAKAAAREVAYPFEVGLANGQLIENLNILQRSFIGRQRDLPVPSSFLVDPDGRVSVIYKGGVSAAQLIEDLQICGAAAPEILARATPFSGKWKTPPSGRLPRAVAVRMVENGLLEDARAYIHQLLPLYQGSELGSAQAELGECERFLGAIAQEKKEFELAKRHYQNSLAITPGQKLVHSELMRIYVEDGDLEQAAEQVEAILATGRNDYENLAQLGKFRAKLGSEEQAIALYRESIALRPHPETLNALADLLRDAGRSREAIDYYRATLEQRPNWPLAANNLAWILATHPDPDLRAPPLAKRWAQVACRETNNRIPPLLGTLAAAHAALGEFEQAVEVSRQAIDLARELGKPELAARLEEKMGGYRDGNAFVDQSLAPAAGDSTVPR